MSEEIVDAPENEVVENPEDNEQPKSKGEEKYKNDLIRFKKEAREAMELAEQLKTKLKEKENATLIEKEQYKELWEQEKQRAAEYENKITEFKQSYLEDKKRSAIEKEAIKLGIKPNYLRFVYSEAGDSVEIETTSAGNINVLGAKEFMESFRESNPDLFKNEKAPYTNNARPQMNTGKTLTPMEIIKLQKKDPKAYNEYMNKMTKR